MNHPKKFVRDTQRYPGFRQLVGGRKPSLKMLTQRVLGVKIQTGEHSSVSCPGTIYCMQYIGIDKTYLATNHVYNSIDT